MNIDEQMFGFCKIHGRGTVWRRSRRGGAKAEQAVRPGIAACGPPRLYRLFQQRKR